jgi:hypothetical protein
MSRRLTVGTVTRGFDRATEGDPSWSSGKRTLERDNVWPEIEGNRLPTGLIVMSGTLEFYGPSCVAPFYEVNGEGVEERLPHQVFILETNRPTLQQP